MKVFWLILIVAILIWYGSVSVLVGIRGYRDIRNMIQRMNNEESESGN